MGTMALTFISECDGDFDKHIQDFTTHLGPLFDQILRTLSIRLLLQFRPYVNQQLK